MANFDDLNAALDAATARLGSIKKDTESLLDHITKLQQNPPPGMTADQQASLDTAVMKAQAITAGLSTLDDLVPDATTAPTSSDTATTGTTEPTEPAPAPTPAPETPAAPADTSTALPPNELNPAPAPAPADTTAAPETPPAPPAA